MSTEPRHSAYALRTDPIVRSTDMHLMNEALARAHCQGRLDTTEAEQRRVARRVLAARRMERRATRAAQRARRLAAAAVALADRP